MTNRIFINNQNNDNCNNDNCNVIIEGYEIEFSQKKHGSYYFYNNYLQKIKDGLELNINNNFCFSSVNKIIGPRPSFKTAFSNNVINILNRIGLTDVDDFKPIKIYNTEKIVKSIIYDEMVLCEYSNNSNELKQEKTKYPETIEFNADDNITRGKLLKYGIAFDDQEFTLYKDLYVNYLKRDPTFIELYDICQSNSEHSRHWFFKGNLILPDEIKDEMKYKHLFAMIKSTLTDKPEDDLSRQNSLVAFNDNSSVIKGFNVAQQFTDIEKNKVKYKEQNLDIVLTAETHNFPTLICPFEGAATGIGGRIRDNHATGRGAYLGAGLAGYAVGEIDLYTNENNNEKNNENINKQYSTKKYGYLSPVNILIEASNGASDYGNKIGEPIIGGFTHSFGKEIDYNMYGNYENSEIECNTKSEHIEWVKPIMFTAGIGTINREHLFKGEPEIGMKVVRIGGPAYKIGLGGGFSSSVDQDGSRASFELNAVQRGDAQMENKLNRVITALNNLGNNNPIISIHDQGAGGLANVVKEIVYPLGAKIDLNAVTLGDTTLHPLEIWCSEFQESDVLLCRAENVNTIAEICKLENVFCDVIGEITGTGNIIVNYINNDGFTNEIINLPLREVLEPEIQKDYDLSCVFTKRNISIENGVNYFFEVYENIQERYDDVLYTILSTIDVGSKRFLTNKVDRSVSGLIAQQQCVGPFATPLSNYSCLALSYWDNKGTTTAIGERPYTGLDNIEANGFMSVGEMITNMMGSYIGDIRNIKASVNWMWAAKTEQEKYHLYQCANSVATVMKELGISADGGKDSLSMTVKTTEEIDGINNNNTVEKTINGPGTVVITGYSPCLNINKNITPEFKEVNSVAIYINFHKKHSVRNNSTIQYSFAVNEMCISPEKYSTENLKTGFALIQELLAEEQILALHDISDGGLITTIIEMCIASGIGFSMNQINSNLNNFTFDLDRYLFNEELGVVIEVSRKNLEYVLNKLSATDINYEQIGFTLEKPIFIIQDNSNQMKILYEAELTKLVKWWESPSYKLEKLQANVKCVEAEQTALIEMKKPQYYLPPKVAEFCNSKYFSIRTSLAQKKNLNVAVIRDEGSNGDREMCDALYNAGFNVFNIHMNELLTRPELLREMRGIAYVGGFSHSDVLGSAHGWYLSIKNNKRLQEELMLFMYERSDTFSIGVCNGCQLMVKQELFYPSVKAHQVSKDNKLTITHNDSGRFESRFATVKVLQDNNIFFKGMKDMIFGVWIAHGEGKMCGTELLMRSQKVLAYVNPDGEQTEDYPYNPNGSAEGITGIVSIDGRHLAMMPHPERCYRKWQLPYLPKELKSELQNSPWMMMFKNIYDWIITF